MNWNVEKKPHPRICPQTFCFFWRDTSVEAPDMVQGVALPHCGCHLGRCLRRDPLEGDYDWYEPDEPALARAGLPWFYFFPAPVAIDEALRSDYIAESEALWGAHHWT